MTTPGPDESYLDRDYPGLPRWLQRRMLSHGAARDLYEDAHVTVMLQNAHIRELRTVSAAQHACSSFLSANAGKCDGCNIEPCADIAAQELLERDEPPSVGVLAEPCGNHDPLTSEDLGDAEWSEGDKE